MAATSNIFNSTFPVYMPSHPALTCSLEDFALFLKELHSAPEPSNISAGVETGRDDTSTLVADTESTADVEDALNKLGVKQDTPKSDPTHPFMQAIHDHDKPEPRNMENMMLTQNADLAYQSTNEPLVDLFSDLRESVSGPHLQQLLDAAWAKDPLSTLKIIFNARSIHLGKSSRMSAYRCFGWLAQNHPLTLLVNLQWLSRPVVEKKLVDNTQPEESDMVLVEAEKDDDDPTRFDVKHGVAHGYWKDLLNLVVLAAEGKFNIISDPKDVLYVDQRKVLKKDREWDEKKAKASRDKLRDARHETAVAAFEKDPFYRALHITVSRLFAEQLHADLALLRSSDKKAHRHISLCAKWAPSHKLFHDKHTFIVSSIAEILHPHSAYPDISDRTEYLRHAREAYRKDCTALRKHLEVVERDLSAGSFANIKYDRVPSLAMNQYAGIFATKDHDRFDAYISAVADGKKNISGATLMVSKLVHAVREAINPYEFSPFGLDAGKKRKGKTNAKALIEEKMKAIDGKVADGQWRALVQRIKDSGKIENSIAVCDVSGSMNYPTFSDNTNPMDSAIGLSLVLAEITAPPFGGSFITFSAKPEVQRITGTTLQEKIAQLSKSEWAMNTNFEAVFRDCILPMARKHKVKQEDMVKQIFVFSDMHFDQAKDKSDRFTTSFERIKKEYAKYGYEMPKLVFWNLAGGSSRPDPKSVTADVEGIALVSGYSQAMLKMFLDNGAFEDPEAEEEVVDNADAEDEELVDVQVTKKQKMDPLSTVRKAISHKAYDMLTVVD